MVFKPGVSGNPDGRPRLAGIFSHEALRVITSEYFNNYTRGQIKEIYEDPKKFDALSTIHAMIVTRIIAAFNELAGGADFDRVMDRVIGKPLQKAEVSVNVYERREVVNSVLVQIESIGFGKTDGRTVIEAKPEPSPPRPNKARTLPSIR